MILHLKDLSRQYQRGGRPFMAVDHVTLAIEAGDFVNLIGRSGSGKSTLLNMAAGMLSPTSGHVEIDGVDIQGKSDRDISFLRNNVIGFIPQGTSALPNLSVLDNVRLPFYLHKREGDAEGRARFLLDRFGVGHLVEAMPNHLSGGELRRVLIARAMINNPKILIADEPTSDLDVENSRQIMETFTAINQEGVSLLVVSHDLDMLSYGKSVYTMSEGHLYEGNLLTPQ